MAITQEQAHWALVELGRLGYAEGDGDGGWSVTLSGSQRVQDILAGLPVADGVLMLLDMDRRLSEMRE